MPPESLDNLHRIGQLKREPFDLQEFERLLAMAEGRFISAYGAAHAAALAALRWYGFRSENRFTVFQCLAHTLQWPPHLWRVLDAAHQKRNLAEYEGYMDVSEGTIGELCALVPNLLAATRLLASES